MRPIQLMLLAGEPSGDALGAELVSAIKRQVVGQVHPHCFGLGGPRLKEAGVELLEDMTRHTVFGLVEALRRYPIFKRLLQRALKAAQTRRPDIILLIDFGGFNLRFAKALRKALNNESGPFHNWHPKIIYYVPPQVWASREGRARTLSETVDQVISIFPFERDWYEARFPQLPVTFVGDPMASCFPNPLQVNPRVPLPDPERELRIAILPGSRQQEVDRHLPLMLQALEKIQMHRAARATVVTPTLELVKAHQSLGSDRVHWQVGELHAVLRKADLAIASSGTVTRECAYLRIPTVVIYKLSWLTYQIARRIVKVRYIAMPNLLADQMLFPELIQEAATPTAIAQEALQLCQPEARGTFEKALERVVLSLGPPGAAQRAAQVIVKQAPAPPQTPLSLSSD